MDALTRSLGNLMILSGRVGIFQPDRSVEATRGLRGALTPC